MIYASKDAHLKEIVDRALSLSHVRDVKNAKDLYIYGMSEDRGRDFAIPAEFPDSRRLIDMFASCGISLHQSCYWTQGSAYNWYCLGLGARQRENNREICTRMVIAVYFWLNDLLDHGAKKKAKRLAEISGLLDEVRGSGGLLERSLPTSRSARDVREGRPSSIRTREIHLGLRPEPQPVWGSTTVSFTTNGR